MQARLPRRATYADLEGPWDPGHPESAAARVCPSEAPAIDLDRWWA